MRDDMRTDEYYMQEALNEAKKAFEIGEVPIGAVIVKNHQIIGRGHNTRELSELSLGHAEVNAIRAACDYYGHWRLTDCEIYVTIEPCPMCAGAIFQSRIKKLVFGAFDKKAGACGSVFNLFDYEMLNHKVMVLSGIQQDACAQLMKDFFKLRRQK